MGIYGYRLGGERKHGKCLPQFFPHFPMLHAKLAMSPKAQIYCHESAHKKLGRVVSEDGTEEDLANRAQRHMRTRCTLVKLQTINAIHSPNSRKNCKVMISQFRIVLEYIHLPREETFYCCNCKL